MLTVPMAASGRSPVLLLFSVFLCGSVLGLEPVGGPPEPFLWTPEPTDDDAPTPAATGSKLSEVCREDVTHLCPSLTWTHDRALLDDCLQDLTQLSGDCKVEVRRLHYQYALVLGLNPELQKECMTDILKWCPDDTEPGEDLECLQDHLEDLVWTCRDVVGNLTELDSQDIQIDAQFIGTCEPVIQAHCHDVASNRKRDLMECLVKNKHQKSMNEKCVDAVTRLQLVQMESFRFSYKFRLACQNDIQHFCQPEMKKGDVVVCLSTAMRNDTLPARWQRVSLQCRRQLKVEELEMSEDIRLETELYDSCKSDINHLCFTWAFGNAQVLECLKDQKKQLSQRCHQRIFRKQQVEMSDPELDYQLMRVCKQMIKRFCSEAGSRNAFECLKQNKNNELMDPKCKRMITKRQITQNTDYRLNPVLRKSCRTDIPKFCQSVLNKETENSELEGQVIACLKLEYADQRLSPDCEDQIRVILQESALDYRLDPQLQIRCSEEISRLCYEEMAVLEQTGQVQECLKNNLLNISQESCKKEVVNMLKQGKADVFVDPVLHTSCALDIKHHCKDIPPGRGRQMSCLMEALQDGNVHLQPECQKRLQDRIDMWISAATVAGVEPLCCPTDQFWTRDDRVPSEATRSAVRFIIFVAQLTFDWFPRLLPYI